MKGYTLGLYEKAMPGSLTWKEKLLAAKSAGYDFVEISIDETDEKLSRLEMTGQERLELVRLMAETGIPIRTMCPSEAVTRRSAAGVWRLCRKRYSLRMTWESGSYSSQVMTYTTKNPAWKRKKDF